MSPIDANMMSWTLRGRSSPRSGWPGRWLQAHGGLHAGDAAVAAMAPPRRWREQQGMIATDDSVITTAVLVTTVAIGVREQPTL